MTATTAAPPAIPAGPKASATPADLGAQLPAAPRRAYNKPMAPERYTPSHPGVFHVVFSTGTDPAVESYSSKLVADRDFAPGERIALVDNTSRAPVKAYSSVQFGNGPHDHFELNSDLLFMNHSCDPSVELYLPQGKPDEWAVRAGPRGVRAGEDITFFYPSTEWDMAQGFDCGCGAKNCLGRVYGAKDIPFDVLAERGLVNEHIVAAKGAQAQSTNGSA